MRSLRLTRLLLLPGSGFFSLRPPRLCLNHPPPRPAGGRTDPAGKVSPKGSRRDAEDAEKEPKRDTRPPGPCFPFFPFAHFCFLLSQFLLLPCAVSGRSKPASQGRIHAQPSETWPHPSLFVIFAFYAVKPGPRSSFCAACAFLRPSFPGRAVLRIRPSPFDEDVISPPRPGQGHLVQWHPFRH